MMTGRGTTFDVDGNSRKVTGGISLQEAKFIVSLIRSRNARSCLETGVAYGVSTVAICYALSKIGQAGHPCKHYGIDPCQYTEFNGAAIEALRRCGLERFFELLEGPSHLMLPRLLEKRATLDLAFIDGWHTFDYTLLDVFYCDKLLRPGGVLLIHDAYLPSKRKVWRYLFSHRRYRLLEGPAKSPLRRVLSFGNQTLKLKPGLGLRLLLSPTALLAAEKVEDYEPGYDFFQDF